MRRVLDIFERMLAVVAAGMLGAFTLVVMYQVAARYLHFVPRALWTEEISRFTFIWMLFIGAAAATRTKSHFVVDLLAGRIGPAWSGSIEILGQLIIAGIGLYLVIGGAHFVEIGLGRISTTSGLALSWIYLAVPVSGFAICVFSIENLVKQMKKHGRILRMESPDLIDQQKLKR